MGLTIKPPDVRTSRFRWIGKGDTIQVGLMSIKGLSQKIMQRIIDEQEKRPFDHMDDFLGRVRPDQPEAEALIHAGALDSLRIGKERTTLLWDLARWENGRKNRKRPPSLFDDAPPPPPPTLPPEKEADRLRHEFSVLGFLCDRHPMSLFRYRLNGQRIVTASNLSHYQNRRITVAGWLITGKKVRTKHGDPMEFLTFEDETGLIETTFFPKTYHRYCHMIDTGQPYLLTGKVKQDWGVCTLNVMQVKTFAG